MNEIMLEGKIYAIFGDVSEMDYGSTFIGSPKEKLQFSVLKCPKGKVFQDHVHKYRLRSIEHTQESWIVLKGIVKVFIFDENKKIIHEQTMIPGHFVVCYRGGHGYVIMADETIVIENKLGDFIGVEEDKEKF